MNYQGDRGQCTINLALLKVLYIFILFRCFRINAKFAPMIYKLNNPWTRWRSATGSERNVLERICVPFEFKVGNVHTNL